MEEESESTFWATLSKLFRQKSALSIEERITAASDEGKLIPEDASMLLDVLRLGDHQVADIMIPRTDIVCAELDDGIDAVRELIIKNGHSRIPVYEKDRDHIQGVVYAKDLLKFLFEPQAVQPTLREIMRTPLFIPETLNLKKMLREFRFQKKHIAIALDEYGGTSGLITLEDVLEEIVGEIEDEHDPSKPLEFEVMADGAFKVSGRHPLEELNEELNVHLESEQVETIGGYLSELAGRVPRTGDTFTLEGRRFKIQEADKRQIRWILIESFDNAGSGEPDDPGESGESGEPGDSGEFGQNVNEPH